MEGSLLLFLVRHAWLSLVPGLVGAAMGSLAGLWARPDGAGRAALYWIPWRGIAVVLLVIVLSSPYPAIWLGLGTGAAWLAVFLATAVLAFALALDPPPVPETGGPAVQRGIAVVRTALTASVGFAVTTDRWGAGSVGVLIQQGARTHQPGKMWLGYSILAVLAVGADLLLAFVGAWFVPGGANRAANP